MPTVRALVTDALIEIGVLEPGDPLSAPLGAIGLEKFQDLMDAWQADRLTLAVQARTPFTLPSGTSTVTLGATGADVTVARPVWLDTVMYVNPGSAPEVEVPIGQMDRDTYAALSIKALSSALPTQCFYQTSVSDDLGNLFFWPQVDQDVDIVLYHPQGIGVPASLNSNVTGPPGYRRAFKFDLAWELCSATGAKVPETLPTRRAQALQVMQRPNVMPATLGVDPAVTNTSGAGYNILSDQVQAAR